jgi:hypothetical protein
MRAFTLGILGRFSIPDNYVAVHNCRMIGKIA